jgi:hypothetical protein
MTNYWMPTSLIGWIDVDRDQAEQVKEMLGLLKEPESLDPHGILPLQILLSNRLFPGMSTQHTRARYVLFAAWHAERLARLPPSEATPSRLKEDERALMRSLLDNSDPNDGVFGRRRPNVQTLPTSVYWTALQTWEIVPDDLTIWNVHAFQASSHRERSLVQRSDDSPRIERRHLVLPRDFPSEPPGFPGTGQHIGMTRDEADYLRDRVAASARSKGTLLASVFVRTRLAAEHYPFPWSADPEAGGEALEDARRFSELIHPARLMYTKLLVQEARKRGTPCDDICASLERDYARWRAEIEGEVEALRKWKATRLPVMLNDPDLRLSATRRRFVACAVDAAASDPDGCWTSEDLAQKVRGIEKAVKGEHARLLDGAPFKRWLKRPARVASSRLDYRWRNVKRFAADLEEAR